MWCIPTLDEEYIGRMEDILALYEKPYDEREPVVCLDERPTPLRSDKRPSQKLADASMRRDSEYVRHGTANVFGVVEPKAGRHLTCATANRKKPAFARMLRKIDAAYPNATKIHLVVDNVSTHSKRALIETFGDREGLRLWERFEVHFTPVHASWLNQAECELSIYVRQCLGKRRIPSLKQLRKETSAWNRHANRTKISFAWKFSVQDARDKFKYKSPRTSRSKD